MSAASPSARLHLREILIAIALVAVALFLWKIRTALVIGFGAIVVATLLRAGARPLVRRFSWSDRWAVMAVVLALLVLFGGFGWLFGAQAERQFAEMREQLPQAIDKVREWLAESPTGQMVLDGIKQGTGEGGKAVNQVGMMFSAVLGGLGHILLIIFAGIYFALDPGLYRRGALRLLPPSRRPQVDRALEDAGDALSRWLVAQLIVMVIVGVLTGVGLALLRIPLSFSLALLIAVLEFVPVVGPIAAAVPGVLLAFARGPEVAMYAVLVYVAVQQIESNVLTPLIQRRAVELPPVVALLSIIAGGLLFGMLGVLFATPLAVVVMTLIQRLYVEDTLENGKTAKAR